MHLLRIKLGNTAKLLTLCFLLMVAASGHANLLCMHMGGDVICPDMVMEGSTSTSMSGSSTFWDDGSITSDPIEPFVDCPVPISPSGPSGPGGSPSVSGVPFDGFPSSTEQRDNTFTPSGDGDGGVKNAIDLLDRGDKFLMGFLGGFGDITGAHSAMVDAVLRARATCDAGSCDLGSLEDFVDPPCGAGSCDAGPLDDLVDTTCDDSGCDFDSGEIIDPAELEDDFACDGDCEIDDDEYNDDVAMAFSELEGCVFVGCGAERGNGLKVPGFPSVPKNKRSEEFRTQYKDRLDEIKKDGGGKSLSTQILENQYRMDTIRGRQDKIDKLIEESEEGREYLNKLKAENDETSANPYGDGRIGTKATLKTGGFVATRLLARNPTPAGIVIGLFLDAVEGGVRYKYKSDLDDALDDAIKSSGITVSGLIDVHRALSADLNAEIELKSELKEARTETDALGHKWYVAAKEERKNNTKASDSAVLRRDTDAEGDRELMRTPGSGISGSRGEPPRKASGRVTPAR